MRARLLALIPAFWVSSLTAQLDLPGRPPKKTKEPGDVLRPPRAPKGDLAGKEGPALVLPSAPGEPGVEPAPPEETASASETLFREVARLRELRLAAPLVERALALGPAALPAARAALAGERMAEVYLAGRVCLALGEERDRAAVAERLKGPLAAEASLPLFHELLERDPVVAAPQYLLALFDQPGAALRTAAFQALEARIDGVSLQLLTQPFASTRAAARTAALELLALSRDPLAPNLVASRLGDPNAQLARRAADLLAANDGAEALLLERAFPPGDRAGPLEWDRARGYAVLGVIEREEQRGTVLLEASDGAARIEALRRGLASVQPLVAGACAAALARIGFRSSAAAAGPWLEREVPHQLVRAGTGAEFHTDFSSIERPALRALALLSGESFGADGDAWRRWWLEHASSFHARHARIDLAADAARALSVTFRDSRGETWQLLAPGQGRGAARGRVLRLAIAQAQRLLERLEREGVFGLERLPGMSTGEGFLLEVAVGPESKGFDRASGGSWLAPLSAGLEEVVEEERWQLYYDPARTTAEEWWLREHERFEGLDPLARRRALKSLVLAAAVRSPPEARDELVAELTRLYADASVPEAADFEPLLAALSSETTFAGRAAALSELARVAAAALGGEAPESASRERLVQVLLQRFGPEVDPTLARIVRDLDSSSVRGLATSSHVRERALAAEGLLRLRPDLPEAAELLRALLRDPEPGVTLAALLTLSRHPEALLAAEVRPELRACAGPGPSAARAAALRVLAHLGGPEVHDLAMEAFGDADPEMQRGGLEALVELADPRSVSLFAALLARGSTSELYAPARRGLKRLGSVGRDECLRLAQKSGPRARREAALFLAEALAPEAAELLLALLAENPLDDRVLWELGVLAGSAFSAEKAPLAAAQAWWSLVVHDDPRAWLLAAAERAGVPAPPRAALDGPSPEGAHFLLALAALSSPELVERAARELERMLGVEFSRPSSSAERAHFQAELAEAVRARLAE